MHQVAHVNSSFAATLSMAVLALGMARPVSAETPSQLCDRLAADRVSLESMDAATALTACSTAVAAAPGDPQLEYQYARALERSGKADQAKQLYQWLAGDNFSPATAALARMSAPLQGEAATREKYAQQLDAVARAAKRISQSNPHDYEDPSSVLAQTGNDPAKILAWVETNTRMVPYAGMLRGASGVLMDRMGNSLDRGLFLADLLHRAGQNVRIARAQISAQAVDSLRARFAASALTLTPPLPTADKAAALKQLGNDPLLNLTLGGSAVDQAAAALQRDKSDVKQMYAQVLPAMLERLSDDPERSPHLLAQVNALLRDHFWVQRQNGAKWEDLDPDSNSVGNLTAAETFLPGELPANLKQRVTVKLSIETLANGKLSETQILQQSWLPSEVAGQAISIAHSLYPQQPTDIKGGGSSGQKVFLAGITDTTVSLPVITVGDKTALGLLYGFDGNVQEATSFNLASMGGNALLSSGKLSAGIASAFGEAPALPAATAASVLAEWLDIEIAVPGLPAEQHRRAIFDLVGADARAKNPSAAAQFVLSNTGRENRALALSGTIDIYILSARPTAVSVQVRAARQLSLLAESSAKSLRTQQPLTDLLGENLVEPVFWKWLSYRQMATSFGAYDKANIALFWRRIALTQQGSLVSNAAFDIVSNSTADDMQFDHRVAQGVADTVAEHVMLRRGRGGLNTAAIYASDLKSGKNWSVLKSGSGARISMMPAATARIAKVIAGGGTVIAPASANAGANWWRIDDGGNTLGIGPGGMGAGIEYGVLLRNLISGARVLKLVGCAVLGTFSYGVERGFSVRTVAEGVVCVGGSLIGVGGPGTTGAVGEVGLKVAADNMKYGMVIGDLVLDTLVTALTTPPEGPELSNPSPDTPPDDPGTYPVCSSPDQGC